MVTDAQPMLAINAFRQDAWTRQDPRLPNDCPALTPEWHRDHALRTDYACCQALVGINGLSTKAVGLTLDELHTIFRVQFPVIRQYETETYYDANGRIVYTPSKDLPGVGLSRKPIKDASHTVRTPIGTEENATRCWEHVRFLRAPHCITNGRAKYDAPWTGHGRELDYKPCWPRT